VKLVRVVRDYELFSEVSTLMSRNLCHLDFAEINPYRNLAAEAIRMSSFLIFEFVKEEDQMKDVVEGVMMERNIQMESPVVNVCSPFGLNSKEMLHNISYEGIISNRIQSCLYLVDLDGS